MCLWSSTITHGFWLDKVSKYHIDSLAKMIVRMATSAQLGPFKDGGIFDTFCFLFLQVFPDQVRWRCYLVASVFTASAENALDTETALYKYYEEIEIF